jgi:hypothetical protein
MLDVLSKILTLKKGGFMKVIRLMLAVAFLVGFVSSLSFAQEGPCGMDVQSYCANERGSINGTLKCLAKNFDRLQPMCVDTLYTVTGINKEAFQAACKADVDKLCSKSVDKPYCIKKNKDKLSPECKAYLKSVKAK